MGTPKGSLIAVLSFVGTALAAPPEGANPQWTAWFNSLRQPVTGASCCTIADCRLAEFRRNGDDYEVLIDERWKLSHPFWARVPPQRMLDRADNPTGRAVVCYTPEAGLLCFVRPPES